MFADYFKQEKLYYSQITELLATYNYNESPELQQPLFMAIQKIHEQLWLLQEQQIEISINKDNFWVNRVNQSLIPKDNINPLEYLYQQYMSFINNILDFDNTYPQDIAIIKSFILKIISEPKGQELIVTLNKLKEKNENLKITIVYGDNLAVPPKNYVTSRMLDKITLKYPKEYHRQSFCLYAGKNTFLSFNIPFIAFSHELIHCLHFWQGNWKRMESFPSSPKSPLFNLYTNDSYFADKEEFWTIESGDLCENSIREEHQFLIRGSHIYADLNDYSKIILLSFLAQLRMGIKNFNTMFFPSNFTLPTYLDTSELEIPQFSRKLIYEKSLSRPCETDSYRFSFCVYL